MKFVKIGNIYINPDHIKMVVQGGNETYIYLVNEDCRHCVQLPIERVMELLGYVEPVSNG